MKSITIISKTSCPPCKTLKEFIKMLPEDKQNMFTILDDTNTDMEDIYNMLTSYKSSSFPTLIFKTEDKETVLTGFGSFVSDTIKEFVA